MGYVIWKSAVYLVISIVSVLITVEFKGEICCGGLSPVRLC